MVLFYGYSDRLDLYETRLLITCDEWLRQRLTTITPITDTAAIEMKPHLARHRVVIIKTRSHHSGTTPNTMDRIIIYLVHYAKDSKKCIRKCTLALISTGKTGLIITLLRLLFQFDNQKRISISGLQSISFTGNFSKFAHLDNKLRSNRLHTISIIVLSAKIKLYYWPRSEFVTHSLIHSAVELGDSFRSLTGAANNRSSIGSTTLPRQQFY